MKPNFSKLLLVLSLLITLTGCGFHLRGHEPLPPQLHVLYLQTNNPYSPLSKQLQQTLQSIGIMLTTDAQTAPVTLQILDDHNSQQLTSQGSNGQLSTYTLYYTMSYQLIAKGKIIQGPEAIATSRNYQVSANQVLSGTTLQINLQDDMRRDLINQLLNHLRARRTQLALRQM